MECAAEHQRRGYGAKGTLAKTIAGITSARPVMSPAVAAFAARACTASTKRFMAIGSAPRSRSPAARSSVSIMATSVSENLQEDNGSWRLLQMQCALRCVLGSRQVHGLPMHNSRPPHGRQQLQMQAAVNCLGSTLTGLHDLQLVCLEAENIRAPGAAGRGLVAPSVTPLLVRDSVIHC